MAEPTSMTPGSATVVTLSAVSAQSAAIGTANPGQPNGTTTVRLATTIDCWIKLGADPTAVEEAAGNMFMPYGSVEYFDIPFGNKIAAIADAAGFLSVTPMADY